MGLFNSFPFNNVFGLAFLDSENPNVHIHCVVQRKGKGLMQGIEITKPIAEVNRRCVEGGLLVIQAEGNVIRFVPPLIVEEKHIDEMIEKLKRALAE